MKRMRARTLVNDRESTSNPTGLQDRSRTIPRLQVRRRECRKPASPLNVVGISYLSLYRRRLSVSVALYRQGKGSGAQRCSTWWRRSLASLPEDAGGNPSVIHSYRVNSAHIRMGFQSIIAIPIGPMSARARTEKTTARSPPSTKHIVKPTRTCSAPLRTIVHCLHRT